MYTGCMNISSYLNSRRTGFLSDSPSTKILWTPSQSPAANHLPFLLIYTYFIPVQYAPALIIYHIWTFLHNHIRLVLASFSLFPQSCFHLTESTDSSSVH